MNRLVASKKINGALVIAAGKLGQTPLSGKTLIFECL